MTDTLRQSLSALVDQEATEFEARKILDATKSRGDLKEYWAACQAISAALCAVKRCWVRVSWIELTRSLMG